MRGWLPCDSMSVSYPGARVARTSEFSVVQPHLLTACYAPGARLQVLEIKK